MEKKKLSLIILIVFSFSIFVSAQGDGYQFKKVKDIVVSSVKDQASTGTCWCFATVSFIEAELMRMGKPIYDLSEMYVVKKTYEQKGMDYIRYHGKSNFSQGGQAHDVMNEIIDHGMLPEEVYHGINYGAEEHNHREFSTVMSHFLDGVLKARRPSTAWYPAFTSIMDSYLGEVPEEFTYKGEKYTPISFYESLDFDPSDYVEITSYTHHPDYEKIDLEVPDNWSGDLYYNVPVDELIQIMENSIMKGYTIVWDGDMSDKGFSHKSGVAVVPEDMESKFLEAPVTEKTITPEYRQQQFNNFKVTDDHLMHLTGLFKDQNGTMYYKTKNSWGPESNEFGGYLNMSETFVKLHTVAIMVHKDAIPEEIAGKLGL